MAKLIELDAYPRGQAIINADQLALIQESPVAGTRIVFVGGWYVDVPHTMADLRELLDRVGVKVECDDL